MQGYLPETPLCRDCPIRLHRSMLRRKGVKFEGEYLKDYAAVPAAYIQGNRKLPPVLFVGEAPGDEEEKAIVPFISTAGQFLRRIINHVLAESKMIDRIKEYPDIPASSYRIAPIPIYFSNACKCRPVGEDGKFRTPYVHEIKHCNHRLMQDIKEINPLLIVALGKSASIGLNIPEARKRKFDDLRGRTFNVYFDVAGRTIPVFVTYHPSKIRRSRMKLAKVYYDDFRNIFNLYINLLQGKENHSVGVSGSVEDHLQVLRKTEEIEKYLKQILERKPPYVALDYEITPLPWDFVPEEVQDFHRVGLDVHNPLSEICFVSLALDFNGKVEAVSFPVREKEVLERHLEKTGELIEFYTSSREAFLKDVEDAYEEFLKTGSSHGSLYRVSRKYRLTGPVEREVTQKSIIHLLAKKFEELEDTPSEKAHLLIRQYALKKLNETISRLRIYQNVLERAMREYRNAFEIDSERILPLLKKLVESKNIFKVVMNPVFEYKFSKTKLGVEMPCFVGIDILDHLLGAIQPSLEDLKRRYLPEMETGKKELLQSSMTSGETLKKYALYNAFDAFITYRIFEKEVKTIENLRNTTVYDFKKERPLSECIYRAHRFYREVIVPLVVEIEINGMKYDVEKSLSLALEMKNRARKLEKRGFELLKAYVPDINPEKAELRKKEGKEILYKAYEKEPILTEKGELSISSSALRKIYETTERENLKKAVLYFHSMLKVEKIISTYLEKYPYHVSLYTGRIHPSYQITRTATGRLAAAGPNVQQVLREGTRICPKCEIFPLTEKDTTCPLCGSEFEERIFLKELFIPENGNTLIVADYSQMEVRLLAELSGDKKLLEAISQGLDLHSYNASSAFGIPYEEIYEKKDTDSEIKRLRQLAKKITFAIVYGSTPEGIAESVDITTDEAGKMIENFLRNHPKVREYIDFCHKHVASKKCIATPIGRVRWFIHCTVDTTTGKPKEASIRREAQNTPIQSISSDINLTAAELERRRNSRAKPVGLVHDSIILEAPAGEAESVREELREVMEIKVKDFLKNRFGVELSVILKADVGAGKNWKSASP